MIVYNEKEAWWKYKFSIASVGLELWELLIRSLTDLDLYSVVD
jgi:hypothetical protein